MATQTPKASGHTTRTKCEKWAFIIALFILLVESLALMVLPGWEDNLWKRVMPIRENVGALLGVAAATALVLSLLWGRKPGSLASVAAVYSGVFAYAAAVFSLNLIGMDAPSAKTGEPSVVLPLALMFLILPLITATLPMLKFSKNLTDVLMWLGHTLFMFIVILLIIGGVDPVTEFVTKAGFGGLPCIFLISLVLAVLVNIALIAFLSTIELAVQKGWPRTVWHWVIG